MPKRRSTVYNNWYNQLPGRNFANVGTFGYLSGKQTTMRTEMATGHTSERYAQFRGTDWVISNKQINMDYELIKNRLAPCGIYCGKCFAFTDGDIKKHSNGLKESLGNFDIYAQRFAELLNEPVFNKYPDFKEVLTYLASVECKGCRKETCKIFKDCKVRDCHMEKKVDFCFQCPDFPCTKTGFDQHLYKRSVDINMRMKAIGVEKYFDEIKDKPRY